MKIDGKKFLDGIGLTENIITSQEICKRLMALSKTEVIALFASCAIAEEKPMICMVEDINRDFYYVGETDEKLLTDVELKRKIKYEKSYLAKKEMQRNLGPDMFTHGKHYYGCRRKRRKK